MSVFLIPLRQTKLGVVKTRSIVMGELHSTPIIDIMYVNHTVARLQCGSVEIRELFDGRT